jgi:peptidoglycan/LPS O-acetylase OafA/YrhL
MPSQVIAACSPRVDPRPMSPRDGMTPAFSLYLDAVRVGAACLVLLAHMRKFGLLPEAFPIDDLGHESVMAFFVLSGAVIAHSVWRAPSTTLKRFALARATRLYSVVVPALLISYGLALATRTPGEGQPIESVTDPATVLVGVMSSLAFLHESWFQWRDVPWNGPYWSLCYEAWYYVLFGISIFFSGRTRIVLLLLAAAIAGPRILLLMPVWCAGVWFVRVAGGLPHKPLLGALLFAGSAIAFVWLGQSSVDIAVRDAVKLFVPQIWVLKSSELFITDYLFGTLVLANFAGFKMFEASLRAPQAVLDRPIRWFAGFTFSIYLFHYPLMLVCERLVPADLSPSWAESAGLLIVILAGCLLLGTVTEKKKALFREWIGGAVSVVGRTLGRTS